MSIKQSKFKTIIDYKSGYTWTKDQELSSPIIDSVRVLTVSNIQTKLDLTSELYLANVSTRDKKIKAISKDWSIAVSSNGNRKRIGNAVFIESDLEYLFASFLTAFKPKINSGLLPKYFFYWLSSHNVQERITSVSEGTTGLGNLDIRYLRNMMIDYPENINEQKAIINLIQKVDEVIEKTEKSMIALNRTKKAMITYLLSGKLKADGSWRSETDFVCDGVHEKYPRGWHLKPLGDKSISTMNPLYSYGESNEFTLVPMDAVNEKFGGIKYTIKKPIEYTGFVSFKNGDTLFAKITPCAENGKVAYIDCLLDEIGFASTEFIVFHPNDLIIPKYLYYLLTSDNIHKRAVSLMEGTTGRQRIPKNIFNNRIYVSIPSSLEEQNSIVSQLDGMSYTYQAKQNTIDKLNLLKTSLIQWLLSGKLQLSNNQIESLSI